MADVLLALAFLALIFTPAIVTWFHKPGSYHGDE